MNIIYIDGQFVRVSHKMIEAFRPGCFKARGVFETMLVVDGVIMDLAAHMGRLRRGLSVLGIRPPVIKEALLQEVLKRNHLWPMTRLRVMVWQKAKQRHTATLLENYPRPAKKEYRVCLIKTNRRETARFADVKSLDHSLFAEVFEYARAQGYDEALILNDRRHIFEACRANVFWGKEGVLYTPPLSSGCLNGIMRGKVMALAGRLKIPFKEENLTVGLLKKADGVFLTNSLIGIMPVKLIAYNRTLL